MSSYTPSICLKRLLYFLLLLFSLKFVSKLCVLLALCETLLYQYILPCRQSLSEMTKLYLRVQTDLSPSCWSSSFSTCWCWFYPLLCSTMDFSLFSGIPFRSCCHRQTVVVCLWSWLQGSCLEYAGGWFIFFPMIFTNRR